MSRSLYTDDRGIGVGIVIFFMMLAVGALLFILLDPAVSELFTMTRDQAQTSGATDQINLAEIIWNRILYVVGFFGALFLIGRAVRESGRSV